MGISIWQLLIVLVILLLVFGPSRIEGIGKSLGKAVKGFKEGTNQGEKSVAKEDDVKREIPKDSSES